MRSCQTDYDGGPHRTQREGNRYYRDRHRHRRRPAGAGPPNERGERKTRHEVFLRDAGNIEQSDAVILIGTRRQVQGLNCAYCGYKTCAENPQENPCAINSIDVGIAIGSACSKAADMRIDTRVMFSAGAAAQEMELLPGCRQVIALALSVSSKSPFFDRKPQTPKA